ncbi:peptidase M23B [Candidatus Ruthia magnifica str. Cm (Calyptogena magnifica)]|uniref:Peptidase M23B n=1 Tax=Ruthia magnifica subsp. Calyptogena magnifica TaxID=413404 RepID=A1AX21_RUTMC|nr:peptidoglycan DD-metalloendopeptidase family protein [Candidatus Ruthturnera calyptogenae]ABL02478.1 peptidase M23B [Candidatus Ruthia magnifica str. Cm (Calyptogena magnifica)]
MENYILILKKLKKINFIILLSLSNITLANINIENTPIPGGIAVVDFQSNHSNPKAFYSNIPIYTQYIKNQYWQALIGIPLLSEVGEKYITIKGFFTQKITFTVYGHHYKEQHITLTDKKKKYVNPNLKHMERIKRERPILLKTRKLFSKKSLFNGQFIRPVKGVITSPFGLKCFYNEQLRRAHTGLDFSGSVDTPIHVPADGIVILTGCFFFNGNTVFIDHGQGLISVYIHMNKYLVKQGQLVNQGDKIGTIGQTGRATGPHLHWGIYLNQTTVNPNLLLRCI